MLELLFQRGLVGPGAGVVERDRRDEGRGVGDVAVNLEHDCVTVR